MASGVTYRLYRSHFRVYLTETANPLAVSCDTPFSDVMFDGVKTIVGVRVEFILVSLEEIYRVWEQGDISANSRFRYIHKGEDKA